MAILLKDMDIEWFEAQYPTLKPDFISNTLEGCITFKIDYYGYKIEDSYDIKVDFNQLDTLGFPKVFDMSRKIYDISQKYDMNLEDLHLNPDGSFCIAIEGEEKEVCSNGFHLQEFFENGIEKFLFQMTFFDREGKFPWGEYAHGYLGRIEHYAEGKTLLKSLIEKLDKKEIMKVLLVNRQSECFCGSGKKLRKCHPMIFSGINKMKMELQ